jgi:FtsH-binding integral membrane protein
MSSTPNPFQPASLHPLEYSRDVDAGVIARFFNAVYAWMAAGLGLTAAVAWWVSTQPYLMEQVFRGPLLIVLIIAQFGLVWAVSSSINRMGATVATVLFLIYAAVNGVMLSVLLLFFAHALIATAFVVTAAMFGATSLYGFVTKRDLTSLGAFMFMGLVGIILASIVSIFWHPTMLTVIINYLGVAVFVGLAAYDTQRLKIIALQTQNDPALAARLSISGALTLYLEFLNLFLFIISILGNTERRR